MKILIGICGIGNGHLGRQINVINLLNNNNHEVVISTSKNNIKYIQKFFSDTKFLEVNIPLICMEQQSNFLYIDEIKLNNYSILEERKRINYFFPKFDYKIISSFFPISINDDRVKIVTPIISSLSEKNIKKIIF